jgi:hypothetical protein
MCRLQVKKAAKIIFFIGRDTSAQIDPQNTLHYILAHCPITRHKKCQNFGGQRFARE